MRAVDVFTPSSTPTVTYVERSTHHFETQLTNAMQVKNLIISIAGPSKTGKTVLVEKVIDPENIISIAGPTVKSDEGLWQNVLDWMEVPSSLVETETSTKELNASAGASGGVGIPLLASGQVQGSVGLRATSAQASASTRTTNPFQKVVEEISNTDFVIFIDDFHYIDPELQPSIGRTIKSAAEQGVRIVVASVPHRSDDVVRSNPELRGRVQSIDLTYWSEMELRQIAKKGFDALNVELAPKVETALAVEAFGSPQLMQALCLNLCFEARVHQSWPERRRLEVNGGMLEQVRERASTFGDFSTLLTKLHSGPKQRGTERNKFNFADGTTGDVYRAVLLAIASRPTLSITYRQLLERVAEVSPITQPVGSSISEAVRQMEVIADQLSPGAKVIEWDEDMLQLVEPYFLFFLRSSHKLHSLGAAGA